MQAARFMGVPGWRIIFRHILPNMSSLLIIDATVNVSSLILAEVGLSFFGFGVQPPDVSLGTLIGDYAECRAHLPVAVLLPGRRRSSCWCCRSTWSATRCATRSIRTRPAGARYVSRAGAPGAHLDADPGRRRPRRDLPQRGRRRVGRARRLAIRCSPARCSASSASRDRASRCRRSPSWACCRTNARVTGSVRFRGRELIGLSDRELSDIRGRRISMIFQDPLSALTPVYTVGDQIAEAMLVHDDVGAPGGARARRRAAGARRHSRTRHGARRRFRTSSRAACGSA